jgi:hypothetical protein
MAQQEEGVAPSFKNGEPEPDFLERNSQSLTPMKALDTVNLVLMLHYVIRERTPQAQASCVVHLIQT